MKNIKNIFAQIAYLLVLKLVKLISARAGNKHLLLIKTDEIGDYVLMHHYLHYFKTLPKYQHHKITLVGNKAWQPIFEYFDKFTVDDVIWLNKKEFKKNMRYRFSFLKTIRKLHITDVINLIFSRSLNFDDAIAYVATGNNKIAMVGDTTNNAGKNIYTSIIDAGDITLFDAVRNRNFIGKILHTTTLPIATQFAITQPLIEPITEKYFVLFMGAGNPERKWGRDNFIQTAQFLSTNYGLTPVICGGPEDKQDGATFMEKYGNKANNICGNTTLLQIMGLLHKAEFLISVDTGILHIAAAVGCAVIGLYSGKFYGRFAPYPQAISKQFYPVYPDFVDEMIANNNSVLYDTSLMKNDTIKMIPAGKVLAIIKARLLLNKF